MRHVLRIERRVEELGKLREWIEEIEAALDLSKREAFAIELALEEVITNIIRYAFDDDDETRLIRIRLSTTAELLNFRVRDEGKPFNPLEVEARSTATNLGDMEPGGFGIPLIRTLMNGIAYSRKDGKNALILSMKIGRKLAKRRK